MGPAIALRLRQHLTLTPQVQQALKLLQMSALEFQQEMDQALSANPFLEEKNEPAAPPADGAAPGHDEAPTEEPAESRSQSEPEPDFSLPRESAGSGSGER